MEERNCTLCGSGRKAVYHPAHLPMSVNATVLHSQYQTDSSHWRYQSVRCGECGHVFASPVFKPTLTNQSYVEQDHNNEFGQDPGLLRLTNSGYVEKIASHLGPNRSAMLDIGCDIGRFLEAAQTLNFERFVGIEPSVHSVRHSIQRPNTTILQGVFEPSQFAAGEFDLITMIHVLDHIREPLPFLRSMNSVLRQDGLVFAVVHNVDSMVAKISGPEWHPFNLIHFDYYTESTLARLYKLAGYRVIETFKTRNFIDLKQLFLRAPYVPGWLRQHLVRWADWPILRSIHFHIPLGNIGIVARKEH